MLAVAVSGGMDSLYSLYILQKELGPDNVLALYGRFLNPAPENDPVPRVRASCEAMGITLHVADARLAFREHVMRPFAESYARAATPNPCVLCNAALKFGVLLETAEQLGAEYLATGHYARLSDHPVYGLTLGAGEDPEKDQSYFLALVPPHCLPRMRFPLSRLRKKDIRKELQAIGLSVPVPRESQEICFIPDDDYRGFLQDFGVPLSGPGPIVLAENDRVIGQHTGLWGYTEGQRRGLGVAWHEPLYVTGKDSTRNALLVGPHETLLSRRCTAGRLNILVPQELWPARLLVRTRYRQQAAPAEVTLENQRLHIRFHEAQVRPAPGQLAVVFDDEGHILAGGLAE